MQPLFKPSWVSKRLILYRVSLFDDEKTMFVKVVLFVWQTVLYNVECKTVIEVCLSKSRIFLTKTMFRPNMFWISGKAEQRNYLDEIVDEIKFKPMVAVSMSPEHTIKRINPTKSLAWFF